MATLNAANVTKYLAPGGDNVISDGYIKTVEKVWIDSYTIAAAIASTSSIQIAKVPKNKKITDIIVDMPVITAPATTCTVRCCTGATTATPGLLGILQNAAGVAAQTNTFDGGTVCTLHLASGYRNQVMPVDVGVYLNCTAISITAGVIKTIVKYT